VKYCPLCQANRSTYELSHLGQPVERCGVCGFQFEDGSAALGEVTFHEGKVLCIDDDPLIRQLLTFALKRHGFFPLSAPDGPTGIAMAVDEHPRLILVDIMMPGMDGYEVCRRLKADPRTATIALIILTAHSDAKLNVKVFQAGADLALTKPFQPERLIATVRTALAMRHQPPR